MLQPCNMRDWELHVHFNIHGDAKELYGDGVAIWYTKHRLELGLCISLCVEADCVCLFLGIDELAVSKLLNVNSNNSGDTNDNV